VNFVGRDVCVRALQNVGFAGRKCPFCVLVPHQQGCQCPETMQTAVQSHIAGRCVFLSLLVASGECFCLCFSSLVLV
jgi:hypothetical protein